jgi:hypothetical protein
MWPHPQMMRLQGLRLPARRFATTQASTLVKRGASTRASSRSLPRVAIATVNTFATLPNRRVSCVAASPSDPHHLGFTQPRALGLKVSRVGAGGGCLIASRVQIVCAA